MLSFTLALLASPLFSYSSLIATTDDRTLYFQARTSFAADTWIRLSVETKDLNALTDPVADVNAAGDIVASTSYGVRSCGFGGSTCFTAAPCSATFSIRGRGINSSIARLRTFVRLDRSGQRAWITQDIPCPAIGMAPPPPLNGLYDSVSFGLIAPSRGAVLASQRVGRRMITTRGQALTFLGAQLQWVDGSGARNVRHVNGAWEAVTDAEGANVVYVEAGSGELHWVTGFDDQRLGVSGSAPALTEDGAALVFLAADGTLRLYDRATRATRGLGSGSYTEFTLGTRAAFAITADDRIVRIDLATGAITVLLQPMPVIRSVDTSEEPLSVSCPLICYGPIENQWRASAGSLLILRGERLDLPGWRARAGEFNFPLMPYSAEAAAIEVPATLLRPPTLQRIELYHADHPILPGFALSLQERMVICLATLHQDFDRLVSAEDPATVGEVVHVFLTGAHREQPALADPSAVEAVNFGPAESMVATQLLDLRILQSRPVPSLFTRISSHGCALPISSR